MRTRSTDGREERVEVLPPWPFRLRTAGSMDGLTRVTNGVVHRLLHVDGRPVLVRVAQLSSGAVLFGAREPAAIARMRRALGVDLELAAFHRRFRADPWLGPALRADPTLRPPGRPGGFEALLAAVTEQLIEYERAVAIQRCIHARHGRPDGDLRDAPAAASIAALAPAQLCACDLSPGRAASLIRAAREVAAGRIDLDSPDPAVQEAGWRRLRAIPGIGAWTVEMVALTGQGRLDQLPAGDLGFLKLVGRLRAGGDPHARADEAAVRAHFARYAPWQGLAGAYAMSASGPVRSALSARPERAQAR